MKTNTESFTDKFKSSADNAAGTVEPNVSIFPSRGVVVFRTDALTCLQSQKSVPQKIGDALSGNSHNSTTTNNATEVCVYVAVISRTSLTRAHVLQPSVGQRVKNAIGMGHNSST